MIIDIHSHALPALDDGAHDLDETKRMLDIYVSENIQGIIFTPHYEAGMGEDIYKKTKESYKKVLNYIKSASLPLKVYLGNEIYYSDSIALSLKESYFNTLNNTKYILVEFPLYSDYDYIQRAVCNLIYMGYLPVIAHAERYAALGLPDKIAELIDLGAYIQINASTILGKSGFSAKNYVKKLLKKHLVHFIATDAHGSAYRRPLITDTINYVTKKYGYEYCRVLTEENPLKVIKGDKIIE